MTGSLFVSGPADHTRVGGGNFWAKPTATEPSSNAPRAKRFGNRDLYFTRISILPLGHELI
jgi:hypothetical protein